MRPSLWQILRSLFAVALIATGGWLLWPEGSNLSQNDTREEVLLWHFWGGQDLDVVRDVVNRFNASQTQYRVREIAMPGNNLRAKLFLSSAGGEPPDLVNIDDPVIADWYDLGLLHSIEQIAGAQAAQAIAQALFPAARELSTADGRLIGICNGLDVRALYINQTFLAEQGWEFPQTLEQLDRLGERVRDAGWQQPRFAFLPPPRRILFFTYLFGGQIWDPIKREPSLDSPEVVAALEWMQGYSRRFGPDEVAAYRQSDQSLPGKSFPLLPQTDRQLSGRYLFALDGQWRTRDLRAFSQRRSEQGLPSPDFSVHPFPLPQTTETLEPQPPAGWVNGNVFVFPKRARSSAGALEFAKFWIGLQTPEQAARTCRAGGWIPVSPEVVKTPEFQSFLKTDPLFRQFVSLASSPRMLPTPTIRGASYLVRLLEATAERVSGNPNLSAAEELRAANEEFKQYQQSLRSPTSRGECP